LKNGVGLKTKYRVVPTSKDQQAGIGEVRGGFLMGRDPKVTGVNEKQRVPREKKWVDDMEQGESEKFSGTRGESYIYKRRGGGAPS